MRKWYEPWEVVVVVMCAVVSGLVILAEYQCDCLTSRYPLLYSGVLGLSSGLFGTIVVFWLQGAHRIQELKTLYTPLAGTYKRTDIGQDNTPDENLGDIRKYNNGLQVKLRYLGGNAFGIEADYWSDKGCKVEAHIEFTEGNRMVATGRYRYLDGCAFSGDFGTYRLYRFQEDDNKLLVLYQHVFPRRNVNNPDANRGWEIWEKASISREG